MLPNSEVLLLLLLEFRDLNNSEVVVSTTEPPVKNNNNQILLYINLVYKAEYMQTSGCQMRSIPFTGSLPL